MDHPSKECFNCIRSISLILDYLPRFHCLWNIDSNQQLDFSINFLQLDVIQIWPFFQVLLSQQINFWDGIVVCVYTFGRSIYALPSVLLTSNPVSSWHFTGLSCPMVFRVISVMRPLEFSWFMRFSVQNVAELPGSRKAWMILFPFATLPWTGTTAIAQSLLARVAQLAEIGATEAVNRGFSGVSEFRWSLLLWVNTANVLQCGVFGSPFF